jgi:hypothetical protein
VPDVELMRMVRAQKGEKALRLKELQNEKRLLGKELYPMKSPMKKK